MTRWPQQETVTDRSQGVKPPTIHAVVPNSGMPEIGLDLQKHLAADRKDMPIILVKGHDNVAMTVQAMQAGRRESMALTQGEMLESSVSIRMHVAN